MREVHSLLWELPEVIIFTPNEVNSYRVFCKHILPNSRINRRTLIALYVTGFDPIVAREQVQKFPNQLARLEADCGTLVGNVLSGVTLDSPFKSNSYDILGAIPQIRIGDGNKRHSTYWSAKDLISCENY